MDQLAIADLARSGLTPEDAQAAQLFTVDNCKELFPEWRNAPGLVFPYLHPITKAPLAFERHGRTEPFARVRYTRMPILVNSKKKPRRYDQPRESGVHAYFPPNMDWAAVINGKDPICFTEGEKKSLLACKHGFPVIGLGGVYNFMDRASFLPILDEIDWYGRTVYIVYDSDYRTNPDVRVAADRLASELSLKRGAEVRLVRLPDGPLDAKGEPSKLGLDDFIVAHGPEAFERLIGEAHPMRKVDSAVLAFNHEAAWIDKDGMVYDIPHRTFLRKGDFTNGSRFSTEQVIQASGNGNSVKVFSVSEEWLKHPSARRYQDIVFDPSTEERSIVRTEGGVAYNMWGGWEHAEPGNVKPFLELHDFVFSKLPEKHRDLPLKLLAYKIQNPAAKIPLAYVLVGDQGCGKSFWAKIVREMCGEYGAAIPSAALLADFNGWAEKALIITIDEAKSIHTQKSGPQLKTLISEDKMLMNEKYRIARQVKNYGMLILTSNEREVAAFDRDDRRMIVTDCPPKREKEFYDRIDSWYKKGGARHALHYLMTYDLQGWTPPDTAPMTAEKHMAYVENLTPTARLAEEMRNASETGLLMWIDQAMIWARGASTGNNPAESRMAREIEDSLGAITIRPYYTPEELAMIFPAISTAFYGNRRLNGTPSGVISRELRNAGIRYLECKDDPRGFKFRGRTSQFLVIADQEDWAQPLSQADFDRLNNEWQSYAVVRNLQQHRKAS